MTALEADEAARPGTSDEPDMPWWRPRRVDLMALGVWAASHVVVLVISLVALASRSGTSWQGLWERWDWERYLTIAKYGYTSGKGPVHDANQVAFFPGFPLVLRAVHAVVRNWTASGLLISFAAGAVAVVALARLTQFEWSQWHTRRSGADGGAGADGGTGADAGSGSRAAVTAVLLLVCSPAAIFLVAGYTESLFLALAVPAWLAARRRHWVVAGLLTALACTVRVNGIFVAVGIAVMFVVSRPAARDWKQAPALALPVASVVGYMAYLKDITNDWLAWQHAEEAGWGRTFTNPITTFHNSWDIAFGSNALSFLNASGGRGGVGRVAGVGSYGPWPFRLEILAALAGVVLLGWLALRRRWAELVYVGASVGALATSTYYISVPREMLLWWPLWISLGIWLSRRWWTAVLAAAASGAAMIGIAWLFLSGGWAG